MEQYRTEDEQVEALRRWWNENGRSTIAIIVLALAAGFGWQAWQAHDVTQQQQASALYLAMLRAVDAPDAQQKPQAVDLAVQLQSDFSSTQYAQFAALQLAAMAVEDGDLAEAEAQLRWVLGKAPSNSDTARVAQLRLARVMAASGDTEQALEILTQSDPGPYGASWAIAQGDILLAAARRDEARAAYNQALVIAASGGAGVNLSILQQKLQSLTPVPPGAGTEASGEPVMESDTVSVTTEANDIPEE
ncbi:MAG: tetratricopeptide repeat protein [Halioglobus sp.]|nr:tetratricopeptide repeat protein [Halioglobus sp.]